MATGGVSGVVARLMSIGSLLALCAALGSAAASSESAQGSTTPPTTAAAEVVASWRADLRSSALADPGKRFANPTHAALSAQIKRVAARYGFVLVKLRVLHPRQVAPLVVVKAADKQAFVAATPAILKAIDPKRPTGDDRTGWAYEGFLLEALDSKGVPFLVVFNHWRGQHAGGGQWASDPSLFPFAHG